MKFNIFISIIFAILSFIIGISVIYTGDVVAPGGAGKAVVYIGQFKYIIGGIFIIHGCYTLYVVVNKVNSISKNQSGHSGQK